MVMNVRLKVQIPATYAISFKWTKNYEGLVCGQVVSVLAFYSDDPSSIPAEVYNFFCKIVVEKDENKQKEAGVGPIFKKKDLTVVKNDSSRVIH